MSNDSEKHGLVKASNTSVVRYSNALIRRGIEHIAHKNTTLVSDASKTRKAPLIAVSDDEEALCFWLASELQAEGYDTLAFPNKKELVDRLTSLGLDAIITDIKSPEMDGFEFVKAAKSNTATEHIPIIVASAYADVKNAVEMLRLGASDFISKPYDLDDILTSLRRVLKKRVLMIVGGDEKNKIDVLLGALKVVGLEVTSVESYSLREDSSIWISRLSSDIVLISSYSLEQQEILTLVGEIKFGNPSIKVMVLGYSGVVGFAKLEHFVMRLYSKGIDLFFSLAFANPQGQPVFCVDLETFNGMFGGRNPESLRVFTNTVEEGRVLQKSLFPDEFVELSIRICSNAISQSPEKELDS
jgi:CheY-like chemotaxis protein